MSDDCYSCANMMGSRCLSTEGCKYVSRFTETENEAVAMIQNEKEYLDKLVNDHWKYIEGVLYNTLHYDEATEEDEARIKEIEYHYKSSAKHFWSHAREYHVGDTL